MRSRAMSDIVSPVRSIAISCWTIMASAQAAPARRAASARSTDTRRLTPGSRMVTPRQLLRGFHRRLVVGDEQELHLLAHLADHRGEAADVGFVQRRVDLVEQAERRGIEAEDREHQRHRGHRLLAAGQQRDVGHALAGRARHDRHAGVEQVLAGEFQVGVAAAEQARIQLLHAGVDAVEGVLEAAAGLAVDLADRVFQRFQRGGQVGVLRVEVFLALRGFGVFRDRGEVDRLQPAQLGVEIGDRLFPRRRRRRRRAAC